MSKTNNIALKMTTINDAIEDMLGDYSIHTADLIENLEQLKREIGDSIAALKDDLEMEQSK